MKLSIRVKLLTGFTLLLLLSSLIQGFSFFNIQQYISTQITTIQAIEANNGADDILGFFSKLNNESFGIAKLYNNDTNDIIPVTEYTIKNNSYIEDITILSPLGHELVRVNPSGPVSQDELTLELYTYPFKSAVAGTPAISKVYYTTDNNDPHIDTFYPIFSERHIVVGVVKMEVNLNQLRSELANIRLGNNGYLYVVDNNGLLISHPSQQFIMQRPILTSRKVIENALSNKRSSFSDEQYINEKNVTVVAKAVKIPDYNWVVVFEQPTSEAFSFLLFTRNLFIITLVVSFILLLLIALYLSENLTRPIRKLQQSAEQVERGRRIQIANIKTGDEIESLSHSFSSLIDQLLQREHLLEIISSQLKNANEQLKVLDELKTEFVSVASHELRTPMTSIKSYLWMALKGKGGELNDKQKYYIERSYNSVVRLVRLVDDLLNISRIESGHISINFQEVNLMKVTQEVIDEVFPRALELGILIDMQKDDSLPTVLADPEKIKEVLFNLIGNSLKFTQRGGSIVVTYSRKNDYLETRVIDNGVGISGEDMQKLFRKFGLISGSYVTNQTSIGGTGLGLYICRSIIDLHHGEIKAQSDGKDKGATFTFTLKVYNDAEFQMFKRHNNSFDDDGAELIHTDVQ
jgi:signal transduction histidine kinase